MTLSQSNSRLLLYVLLAVLGSALADIVEIRTQIITGTEVLWIDWLITCIKAIVAGCIVWRAYIDQTPSDVKPKDEQP